MPNNLKNKNQPKDELDLEVDKMLELAKDERFESGIYNFCDRWCEKCADTTKCYLFAEDEIRKARKLVLDQEAENESAWLEDMEQSFAITHRLLERKFKELGIDMEKVLAEAEDQKNWDDNAERRYNDVPVYKLARKYMKEARDFLDKFHENRFKFYPSLGMEIDYSDIKGGIETITWYFTMLPTKIWRYLYEKESLQREEDQELKEMMAEDLGKFYALANKCIAKSIEAWDNLGEKRIDWALNCQYFRQLLQQIKQELKQ